MQTPNLGDTLHPTSLSLRRQASACAAAAATDMITHEALDVQRVSALSDNYVWLLTERSSGKIAVVDPSESKPVIAALQQRWASLTPGQLPPDCSKPCCVRCLCQLGEQV